MKKHHGDKVVKIIPQHKVVPIMSLFILPTHHPKIKNSLTIVGPFLEPIRSIYKR
jgi:hypothetical protein